MLTEEQKISTYSARVDYLYLLAGGLNDWAILSEDEQKKMDSLQKEIRKYLKYLFKELDGKYYDK